MASIRQSIRSSTASKRPTSAIADGQIALNTASGTPGMFFKDSAGNIIKTGPAHYGASAPNSSPAVGGSTGNSIGEAWLDSSLTPAGWKIWSGSAWVNATPLSSDTVQGLVELATNAETQAGADTARAVTSAGLQSKVSDSISTASSSGIASSSAVKTAYDLANAALPKSGGIITGNLEIGSTGSLTFEGSTADGFETTLAVVDPTLDRTITFPNITGTVVTTGDTGTVTSTMILDGTIVDADINASAEIAVSKLADGAARQLLQTDAAGTGVEWASNIDIPGTLDVTSAATFDSTVAVTGALTKSGNNVVTVGDTGTVTSTMILDGTILNADVNASAAIAGTKISPDFGAQTIVTTGVHSAAAGSAAAPSMTFTGDLNTGIYSPGTDQVAISTNGTGRLFVDASGHVGVGVTPSVFSVGKAIEIGHAGNALFGATSGQLNLMQNAYYNADFKYANTAAASYYQQLSGAHIWHTASSGTAGNTISFSERMRITSAGLVGVGTSSPATLLEIKSTTTNSARLRVTGTGTTAGNFRGFEFGNGSIFKGGFLQDESTDLVSIFTPIAGQAVNITSAGNVGVGTTSPGSFTPGNLVVEAATTAGITISDSTGGGTASIAFSATSAFQNKAKINCTMSSQSLEFSTAGSERARIDSSGRLGIGTSAPQAKLHILDSTATTVELLRLETAWNSPSGNKSLTWTDGSNVLGRISVDYTSPTAKMRFGSLYSSGYQTSDLMTLTPTGLGIGTTSPGGVLEAGAVSGAVTSGDLLVTTGSTTAKVTIGRLSGTSSDNTSFRIRDRIDRDVLTVDTNNFIYSQGGSERCRVDASGRLLVGTSTVTQGGATNFSVILADFTSQFGLALCSTQTTGTANYAQFVYNGTVNGSISSNGTTTTYAITSDYRLKENVIPVFDGIARFKQLKPSRFNFIGHPESTIDGFIAHEVQQVIPEAVVGEKDATNEDGTIKPQGIDQSKLVPLLTAALQEAIAKIEALEARLTAAGIA